jgi:hypothetical protein
MLMFAATLGGLPNLAYAGFGITPPYVHNDTLRPGSEYTQEIIIVRNDPVEDLYAELGLNLPAIESWFSFDRGMKFLLPKGETQVKLNVTVRVPEDAKLGPYNGNIRIRTVAAQNQTTGVSIALGAQIDVQLKVVDKILNFEVKRVELHEAEEGYKKFWLHFPGKVKFSMHIQNTGNVPIAPERVLMRIYDVTGSQLLESIEHTNQIEEVLPFDTRKVVAYLPTKLPPGGYRVKYTIEKSESRLAQEGELGFSILPKGTITGYEAYGFEGLALSDQLTVIIPAALIVLLVVVFGFLSPRVARKPRAPKVRHARDDDEEESYVAPPPQRRTITPPVERPRPRTSSSGVVDLSRRK